MHVFLMFPVYVWHVYANAFAVAWHASHTERAYALASLRDMIAPVIALSGLFAGLMAHPRTRRVTMALVKFTHRHSPRWAKPAMVACALFPGQADELVLVAILLIPILRNSFNRRVLARIISTQWHGR